MDEATNTFEIDSEGGGDLNETNTFEVDSDGGGDSDETTNTFEINSKIDSSVLGLKKIYVYSIPYLLFFLRKNKITFFGFFFKVVQLDDLEIPGTILPTRSLSCRKLRCEIQFI